MAIIPTEFFESFEKQYPRTTLEFTLPKSLENNLQLKEEIVNNIHSQQLLTLVISDANGVQYDMIRKLTKPRSGGKWEKLTDKGYDIMLDKLYATYGGNMSPRTFAFMMDDLSNVNPNMFEANLIVQQGQYLMRKAIALNKAWMTYCLEYPSDFKMDYDEYNKTVNNLGQALDS